MTCKAVAESAVSGLRARCRTALQQSVPPPAVDPGKKLAAAAGLCSKLRIPRGSPACSRSFLQRTALQTRLRIVENCSMPRRPAPGANSAAETASAANSSGKPLLAAAAACRVPLQTCLLRKGAQLLLCKKLLTRLCKHCAAGTAAVLQSCEFFGEALACNVSFQLQRLVCQRCRVFLLTILQSFSNSFSHIQIICPCHLYRYPPIQINYL